MNKVQYTNEQGECPKCHSYGLEYDAIQLDQGMLYYPWTCIDCGAKGSEWYELSFVGHNIVNEDGEEVSL